jgi:hypothetical protein
MKKILLGSAVALATLSLQSCLTDDKELFDESAANRIEAVVAADKQLLESATNGWQLHYYTGKEYTGGGYTMFVKFKDGKAYASSDIAPADSVATSSYDVIKDKGPVLTFNTENGIMHFLAQPYQDDVDGEQGDYEFVIMRTTNDSIFVQGKKWGNEMVFTRVADDVNWEDQINKMHKVFYSMKWLYTVDGAQNEQVSFDPSARRMYVGDNDDAGVPFYVTTDGIAFREAVKINGKELTSLHYDATTKMLSSTEAALNMKVYIPEGYHEMDDFIQAWKLKYYDSESKKYVKADFNIQGVSTLIEQKSLTDLYCVLSLGNNIDFPMFASYSPITGKATIPQQYVKDPTGTFPMLLMLGADSAKGNIYFNDWEIAQDATSKKWMLRDPKGKADSILLLGVTNQGAPLYVKKDGSYTDNGDDPDIQSLAVLYIFFEVSTLTSN